jgi:hypothetical protein
LGWWSSDEDKAQWIIQTPLSGMYTVSMEWSCDDRSAGNKWQLQANDATLTGTVESSGGWETYRNEKVGTIDLPEGLSTVTIHADGPVRAGSYLFDLREITLRPVSAK